MIKKSICRNSRDPLMTHRSPIAAYFISDEIGERYGEIEYRSGKVLQPRRDFGGDWNS